MKPSLQTSLGQQLVLTPQLRQAIHMLQLSIPELEAEIILAVESNPLLEWEDNEPLSTPDQQDAPAERDESGEREIDGEPSIDDWSDTAGPTAD